MLEDKIQCKIKFIITYIFNKNSCKLFPEKRFDNNKLNLKNFKVN